MLLLEIIQSARKYECCDVMMIKFKVEVNILTHRETELFHKQLKNESCPALLEVDGYFKN